MSTIIKVLSPSVVQGRKVPTLGHGRVLDFGTNISVVIVVPCEHLEVIQRGIEDVFESFLKTLVLSVLDAIVVEIVSQRQCQRDIKFVPLLFQRFRSFHLVTCGIGRCALPAPVP